VIEVPSAKKRREREKAAHRTQIRLWGIVGVVGLAVVVLALLLSRGGTPGDVSAQEQPVAVSGAALPPMPSSGDDPAVGMQGPTLAGASFDGTSVTIDPGASGNPTAIWFLAHWCPHCNAEVPRIVSLDAQGALPANVDLYAVSTSVNPSAPNYPPSTWLEQAGWPAPVLADDATRPAATAYGQQTFPFLVLLDAEGNVVYRHAGELGDTGIQQALQQLTG
jgi:thiol-disulfide isomerase/thioredoxin